jgi:transketolase
MGFVAEHPQAVPGGLTDSHVADHSGDDPAGSANLMAIALRALIADTIETGCVGTAETTLALAEAATVLWSQFLKFDAADPLWPDCDRFVLSGAQGAVLLPAVLQLTGQTEGGAECLRSGRGQPDIGGLNLPAGQGIGQAVGMALAERLLASRFGRSLVDHRIWVLASADELMQGVSQEAAGLAGSLRLDKLTLLFADSSTDDSACAGADPQSLGGQTHSAGCDDILRRLLAQGWAIQRAGARNPSDIEAALSFAMRAKKPTVIALRTGGGRETSDVGAAELRATPDWDGPRSSTPPGLAERWLAVGALGAGSRRAWLKRMAKHPLRGEFERVMSGRLPDDLHEALASLRASIAAERPRLSSARASLKVQEALAPRLPELLAGAAGAGSARAQPMGMPGVGPGNFAGRFLLYGLREHAMAAAMNGMVLHGGLIPTGATELAYSDYLRPALRLSCLMGRRVIHLMTHDGAGEGHGGGPPAEQLMALRTIPGLLVFRPADAMETAEAWDLALRRIDGPSLLVLSRQPVPTLRSDAAENRTARGGYVLAEADGARQATLIASGPEVSAAMTARAVLADEGIGVAVVSLPCWELFAQADPAYRQRVLGGVPRFGIEAGSGFGWERWLGDVGNFLGFGGYCTSASCQDLYEHVSLVPEAIVAVVKKRLS